MRQKAVSIAPQKEAPIQSEPKKAAIPIVVEFSSIRFEHVGQGVLLDVGEEALQVVEHARLDPADLQHLAEDEEDQQGEGEDRQHQVVGDHRREPGDVLAVGALPEGTQPGAGCGAWIWALTSETEATIMRTDV